MPKQFDDYDYTRDAIIKQLSLIELHGKDGSAVDAGCACIETKHTYMLEGLTEEMVGFAKSEKEKQFYQQLSDLARQLRKKIDAEDWNLSTKFNNPVSLNACELKNPSVAKKLSRCIKKAEKKPGAWTTFNPVAVCRSSIKCPQ